VLITGVTLISEIVIMSPENVGPFRKVRDCLMVFVAPALCTLVVNRPLCVFTEACFSLSLSLSLSLSR
jgi:hypothetical protein